MALAGGGDGGGPLGESFVSDIFNEVDEEVRREQLKKLWERYGILIIAAGGSVRRRGRRLARLPVVGSQEGRRGGRRVRGRGAAGRAGQAHRRPRRPSPRSRPTARASYRVLAKLREAARAGAQRDREGRGRDLRRDRGRSQPRPDAARPRGACAPAMLLVDTASYDDLKARLEPLTAADRTFRHSARELLALVGLARATTPRDAALDRHGAGRSRRRRRTRAARSRC